MPLLLSDEDVRALLTMDDCLAALESACKQEGTGHAVNRTKSTIYVRSEGGVSQYVSMEGGIGNPPVFALRVRVHGRNDQEQGTGRVGAHIVMLFGADTGELLAVLKQRVISTYRVAAVAGLAAREMARPDTRVLGILGSGGMAHAHALAYSRVRPLEEVKVYSPNPEHRSAFADWVTEMTGVPATPLDDPEAVVRGADIVAACTNARRPIVRGEWLDRPGVHMTGVQLGDQGELDREGLRAFHRLVTYLSGTSAHLNASPEARPWMNATSEDSLRAFDVIPRHHTLPDVLNGKAPGRENDTENTYFFSEGTGVQFAAIGAVAYFRARERGAGLEMPAEWASWFSGERPTF